MPLQKEEINRKLLHILSGTLIPAGILYIPLFPGCNRNTPVIFIAILAVLLMMLELIRFRLPALQKLWFSSMGSVLRAEEDKKITGATWIFASALICTLSFPDDPAISSMVISMFILGDAVAAIVGQSMGRVRIGKKSLEGSVACFSLCFIMATVVFPLVPRLLDSWNGSMPIAIALSASLSIAMLELFPIRISPKIVLNDNLYVPVITGFVMMWLHQVI
jgi:diacylglycerol kinase (CTP)